MRNFTLSVAIAALLPAAIAQTPHFNSVSNLPFDSSGPMIRAHAQTERPFTVAGEHGVLLGQQNGTLEAWILPVKVLSHLTIEADIDDYTVPIDVNQQSAEIEVRPDRTVITYSHIGFTVRQIMFSPDNAPPGTGPLVLFQFDCLHPTDFTLRFTPELRYMWPERNEGTPGVEWVAPGPDPHAVAGGFYVLHSDYPDLAAAITIPGARAGIMAPYQERPQVHPVELKLHIDPADRGKLFPLLMAVGTNTVAANTAALARTLEALNASIASTYLAHASNYRKLLADSTAIATPNPRLDEAFQWAEVSIEQLKAKPVAAPQKGPAAADQPLTTDETALVAGYYASGDSARPGFGWFFGRDALYTLYAVNGFGDFALTRSELEFLMHRQRADGKIMHEYSQTAAAIDWQQFPYEYAAADSTPLFLLAMLDYVRASDDVAFLKAHRDTVEKAWAFETSHADTNGIYANTQGTGWVESWPGGLPHQEIYLASLDQQASAAMAQIFSLLGDEKLSLDARTRAETIARTINQQFFDEKRKCYAFSRNADGSLDRTSTVYPALARWSAFAGTNKANGRGSMLAFPEGCLQQFASAALNTDWGLRDVANTEPIYNGMSYHQGSVWPLFTGWAAMAEYRGGQPLAGYQMLMENANLTRAQDLGAVTELLSGDFFVPFGRSTSHQLWSSAMVITPVLRGLFGIRVDAQTKTLTVNPRLPAGWEHAEVRRVPLGAEVGTLTFQRRGAVMEVRLSGAAGWALKSDLPVANESAVKGVRHKGAGHQDSGTVLRISTPEVEADVPEGVTETAPLPGARTERARVLRAEYGEHQLRLMLEGRAGTEITVPLVQHVKAEPAVKSGPGQVGKCTAGSLCNGLPLEVKFPAGSGWVTAEVTVGW